MPKYDFQCDLCEKVFELTVSFDDSNSMRCIECGGRTKKLFSPPAIVFKGDGWYSTDSRKKTE